MSQARFAKTRRAATIFALALSLLPAHQLLGASSERLFESSAKGLKGIRITGFRGQVRFVATKDTKLSVDAKSSKDEALQQPWRPLIQNVDGWIVLTVSGPPSKSDWKLAQIPPIDLEIRSAPIPAVVVWKEGEIQMKDWKAPTQVTHHRGRTVIEGGKDLLKLNTLDGDAHIALHQGRVEVDNYNAKVLLSQIDGTQRLENFSGHLTVDKSRGDIHLRASQGKTDIRDSKGSLEFDLAQGEININGLEGSIRGQGDQGSVNAVINGPADFKVRTDATKVSVLVARSSGAKVDLGTQEGNFAVSFPMKYDRIEKMKLMKGQLSGKDGGLIFVRTKSGDVRLKPSK